MGIKERPGGRQFNKADLIELIIALTGASRIDGGYRAELEAATISQLRDTVMSYARSMRAALSQRGVAIYDTGYIPPKLSAIPR